MPRKAKAVLCRELNKPVVVEAITVEPPRRGEVAVKLGACGVCHSDLSATNGTIPMPPPLILGHEAAGEVDEHPFAVGFHFFDGAAGDGSVDFNALEFGEDGFEGGDGLVGERAV